MWRRQAQKLTIRDLGDALSAAMGLSERFRRAHAAAVLDRDGQVIDLTAFCGREHSIMDAIEHAASVICEEPAAARLLLLSVVRHSVQEVRELDLWIFRRARRLFARRGLEVVDWLQTDRRDIRSMAITEGTSIWETGPDMEGSRPPPDEGTGSRV